MSSFLIVGVILAYFGLLVLIGRATQGSGDNKAFFTGDRSSPWYLVAFGMIGASLSGVTFISVPGEVGNSYWYYMQLVIGYIPGYMVIAFVLMPLYYKMKLVSIYGFLQHRFGESSYKTGAWFFLLSQSVGAALRLFLVAGVLQVILFDRLGVPFAASVAITIVLIWVYTFRGGIKTIVWTDTLQTTFMLAALVACLWFMADDLNLGLAGLVDTIGRSPLRRTLNWDWQAPTYFWKQFVSGALIAIVMTGLDQNMMQKNLTVRTLAESQKNMVWFTAILVGVNLLFLSLGVMLYEYGGAVGMDYPSQTDQLFPLLATNYFGPVASVLFLLGITAAAYSSADSALTALTTSFCVDILQLDRRVAPVRQLAVRRQVHVGFSVVLFCIIMVFYWLNDDSLINTVFKAAAYTYGPLLGLFSFGMFSKRSVRDRWVPMVCVAAPFAAWAIDWASASYLHFGWGFLILLVNGLLTVVGLWALSSPQADETK